MLKYIKDNMTTIDGISIYPMISFGIFFIFFAVMLVWVIKSDKEKINEMAQYPLLD